MMYHLVLLSTTLLLILFDFSMLHVDVDGTLRLKNNLLSEFEIDLVKGHAFYALVCVACNPELSPNGEKLLLSSMNSEKSFKDVGLLLKRPHKPILFILNFLVPEFNENHLEETQLLLIVRRQWEARHLWVKTAFAFSGNLNWIQSIFRVKIFESP